MHTGCWVPGSCIVMLIRGLNVCNQLESAEASGNMCVSISASKPVSHVPDSVFTGTCRVGTQASCGRALPAIYIAGALQGNAAPSAKP